jgi:hypothetical protein
MQPIRLRASTLMGDSAQRTDVVLLAVAGLGTVLLVVRAVVARDEPWWVSWTLPAGAAGLVVAAAVGFPLAVAVPAVLVLLVGLGLQIVWSYRSGRYIEDDVQTVWRRVRGKPQPSRRRHRAPPTS